MKRDTERRQQAGVWCNVCACAVHMFGRVLIFCDEAWGYVVEYALYGCAVVWCRM